MDLDLSQLPPAYRAAFEAQRAQIAVLTEANARLEHLVAEFRQAVYGKKSEKLSPDERQLACEDLEAAVAEVKAAKADARRRRRAHARIRSSAISDGCPPSCPASSV